MKCQVFFSCKTRNVYVNQTKHISLSAAEDILIFFSIIVQLQTIHMKCHFLLKLVLKKIRMTSATILLGALRVKKLQLC